MLDTSVVATILELDTRDDLANFLFSLTWLFSDEHSWIAVTQEGVLRAPDDEHFLGAMITACDLEPEEATYGLANRVAVAALTHSLPLCDLCHDATARYDAEVANLRGWGYLCGSCYRMNSSHTLGLGKGQYLFTVSELKGPIRQVIEHIGKVCWNQ